MITLHHLNQSRSKRIIWLLEELGVDYQIKGYRRDKVTHLAPQELKDIHPLGKSPVIEDNGLIIAESGAITEYLINKYNTQLAPKAGSNEYVEYSQWMHFAESSAMLPLLLTLFVEKDGAEMNFLPAYASTETSKVLNYFESSLANKRYLVGDALSGADIMMSFVVNILKQRGQLGLFPNISAYSEQLETHPALNKADQLEAQY